MERSFAGRMAAAVALVLTSVTLGNVGGGTAWAAPEGSPWGANYFTNAPLITHEGKTVRFYDDLIKGKIVVINFVYTNCPQLCPLVTAKLVQVQKLLGDRVGRDVFIYSITIDPERDTPEVLTAYAQKFGVGPGWLFLTGKRQDIDLLRNKLGDRRSKNLDDHSTNVFIGNETTGQWIKASVNDPPHLARQITDWLDPTWSTWKGRQQPKSFADAPRSFSPEVKGQVLFRTRCSVCHTIGQGELVGPDLKGVTTRRERAWLASFLAAPDKMRAQSDPIAVELSSRYKNVLMPNLGLTETEVTALIAYLETRAKAPEEKQKRP